MSAFLPPALVQDSDEMHTPELIDRFMQWALGEVPRVVQIAGGPIALVLVGVIVALIVWRRHAIMAWLGRRSESFWVGVAVMAVSALVVVSAFGFWVWDYTQHDNEFCNSCHVMEEPFERFAESEHSQLLCHDCHQQSIFASLRQLHLWVLNRPSEVGLHAPVPTGICAECHVTEDPDSTWQRIASTAGHRLHLEADTTALEDVMCVTCHGMEVHRFAPADETCGQSGCHDKGTTTVVLGEMAGQTSLHCVTCHEFTAPVEDVAVSDTLGGLLTPDLSQCLDCHEMQAILVGFNPEAEPHDAVCGTCHNPHTQEAPDEAAGRCAECHAPADELTPFHRGLGEAVLEDCMSCHEPHTFEIEGEDCLACHADIVGGTPTAGPNRPTTLREDAASEAWVAAHPGHAVSAVHPRPASSPLVSLVSARVARPATLAATTADLDAVIGIVSPIASSAGVQARQQGFDHDDHRDLECTDCHSMEQRHGEITVESRTECLECHHGPTLVARGCASCHGRGEISTPRSVAVEMTIARDHLPRSRALGFDHDDHGDLVCATCHGGGIVQAVQRDCASCHVEHHSPTAECTSCHLEPAAEAHTIDVHTRGCAGSGCHESRAYGNPTTGRETCLACHQDLRDHRADRACAGCHQLARVIPGTPAGGRR